ncbi:MAG: hypothetical protein ACC682_04660 [Gemmatimonadota bacterium]
MTDHAPPGPARTAVADAARRSIGLVLLVLVVFPAFRLLDPTDFMAGMMASSGEANWRYTWGQAFGWRTGAAVLVAGLVALATRGRLTAGLAAVGRAIDRTPGWAAASAIGLTGAALTLVVVFQVFDQRTILNDASVQLIQARYFAAGMLSGPVLALPEFWSIQFMVQTAAGWVAQYPPGHALVLAGGYALGAPWLAMVAAVGLTGAMVALSFDRLLPGRRSLGRVAALLTVSSPLLLGLAGGYMSHATLAAAASVALYFGLRAENGHLGWAVAAGAAVGLMVTIRPVSGLLLGVLLTGALWLMSPGTRVLDPETRPLLIRRFGAWVGGGLPFAVGFGLFNARFFGGPLTLGYVAASGPNHGLGFHEDPWGRMYTPTAAVGNSSAELLSLSRELLGTPIPLVALIGLFLLTAPRLSRGERVLLAWATLPLVASALYWHHDLVFGPRMLGEAVPGWTALAVLSFVGLARLARGADETPGPGRAWAGDAIAAVALMALAFGAVSGGPERLGVRRAALGAYPDIREERPSLVFVHEPWGDRLGGRLSGRGLRLDSVRTLLTRYHPCQLEAGLLGVPQSEATSVCQREEFSDAAALVRERGSLGITGLLWLDDLPGLPGEGVLWVRDLGPERNAAVLAEYPDRVPLFLLPGARVGTWDVVPYAQGSTTLWRPLAPLSDPP